MDAGRAALMQMQIKHNAEDLQDYLKGLESWEEEIKTKDSDLSRQKPILKEQLPPVRSHTHKEELKKKKKQKKKKVKVASTKSGPSRISSYDYRSWDKFDVDKACEEVDYEVRSSSSYESSSEDEEVLEAQRKQQAVMEKEKGNEHFKRREHELAVECYTRAMELDPGSAVMPANRAMALLKLERYAAAEEDCSLALELDSTYVKAFLRRATARAKLSNFTGARQDFESVLKIEPSNKLATTELERLDREVGTAGMRYLRPVKRPPHLRSKKPLKRIAIQQIDDSGAGTALAEPHLYNGQQILDASAAAATTSQPEPGFLGREPLRNSTTTSQPEPSLSGREPLQNSTTTSQPEPTPLVREPLRNSTTSSQPEPGLSGSEPLQNSTTTSHLEPSPSNREPLCNGTTLTSSKPTLKSDATPTLSEAAQPPGGTGAARQTLIQEIEAPPGIRANTSEGSVTGTAGTGVCPAVTEESRVLPGTVTEGVAAGTRMVVEEVGGEEVGGTEPESGRSLKVPPVPISSIQFQADWKRLRRDREVLAQYFKALPVTQYPLLLQQSLETDVLQDIVSILHQDFVKCGVPCVEQLTALTKVKRFSVALLFLSKLQKEGLVSLFDELLDLVEVEEDKQRVRALAQQFGIP